MTMPTHSRALSAKSVALHADMRKLWEDHVTWTRLAIISLETGTPDTDATVARLLRNQTDIGNAIKPYYGGAAGNELTRQLRTHILIAADVVAAAKAGDQAKLADAQARWTERGPDREGLEQRQSALLAARNDEGGDAHAPQAHDGGSRRAAPGTLAGRRRRLRQGAPAHPAHVGHAERRDRQAVRVALPLARVRGFPPPGLRGRGARSVGATRRPYDPECRMEIVRPLLSSARGISPRRWHGGHGRRLRGGTARTDAAARSRPCSAWRGWARCSSWPERCSQPPSGSGSSTSATLATAPAGSTAAVALFAVTIVLGAVGGRRPKHARQLAVAERDARNVSPELRLLLDDRAARTLNYLAALLVVAIVALMVFKPGAG